METVRAFHQWWAWVWIIGNAVAGSWSLAAAQWPQYRSPRLWWFTAAAQLAVFVQAILGVVLVAVYDLEPNDLHMFYGFIGIATVGIIYSYRQQMEHSLYLLYGLGGLFVMGLGLRGVIVGPI